MNPINLAARVKARWRREMGEWLGRRPAKVSPPYPLISFSFDDFPRSALSVAGAILESYGVSGTYYVSLGLMGKMTPTGEICHPEDVVQVVERGHELGCHTFDHCHAWETKSSAFEESILRNREALVRVVPGMLCRTLSYPISGPSPGNKLKAGRHFDCCRGSGQTFNLGHIDRNNLKACFLEQSRDHPDLIEWMIDQSAAAHGWLIFATHDVCEKPSRFGCQIGFFERIVRYAAKSGATILPVYRAWTAIRTGGGQ